MPSAATADQSISPCHLETSTPYVNWLISYTSFELGWSGSGSSTSVSSLDGSDELSSTISRSSTSLTGIGALLFSAALSIISYNSLLLVFSSATASLTSSAISSCVAVSISVSDSVCVSVRISLSLSSSTVVTVAALPATTTEPAIIHAFACATNTDLHIPDNFPAMVFNNSFILHASPD